MYFKRLEMQGFKTFVDATSLDFESGITAIVGPNGCGKSNVVDSLRWVLGEQSAKALRGSRMEDVIFNGTDQRKAVGMAEVSLTIANPDRLLPTDHDEVTITRRTFRSGDSEYLINKIPCRLRDIHDLFMDTGIGTNAYSILEQGKIDLIVSSRPADRRFVFEEAAGISKYKSRKDESLRKLEATEQNFLRVNDIAVEVKRQIGSLERQAQKARRYQELKQELTTLEVSQGRRELQARRRALRKIEQEWEEQRLGAEEAEGRKRNAEEAMEQLSASLVQVEEQWNRAQVELHALTEEMIKAEDFIASAELRKQDLNLGIGRLEAELVELAEKDVQLRTRNSGALEARAGKERQLDEARRELAAAENRLNELENELKERAMRIQDQQNQLLKIVDQMSTLRGTLKNLEIRRSEREQDIIKLDRQMQTLGVARGETEGERAGVDESLRQMLESIGTLRQERDELGREKERLEHMRTTLAAMVDNFTKTMTQLTSRLTWIEELKNGLEGYASGAKSILLEHNARPERFPGIIGPVVNFIRTEAKYEFAFEALLGHQLQNILVQSESEARDAMAFLNAENRGRATFIPLDLNPGHALSAGSGSQAAWLQTPGVFGWAQDLVRIDERFQAIFRTLLRNTLMVADRETARQVRAAGATCTLVTLEGEIDSEERWLTGGSQDISERGLMGREREIEELQSELRLLEKNLSDSQAELEKTQEQLTETLGSLEAGAAELHELEIKSAQSEKSLESLNQQLREIERQYASAQTDREQVAQALAKAIQDHEEAAQRLLELETTDRQTQDNLSTFQSEIEDRRHEFDTHSLRAGELRVSAASLEQQLQGLNAETERVTLELAEIEDRRQDKISAIARDHERLAALEAQAAEKRERLDRMTHDRTSQEHAKENLRQHRESLLAQKNELSTHLRTAQSQLDAVKQTLHQAELDKAQLKMNLTSLETYLQDSYQLDLNLEEEPAEPESVEMSPTEAGIDAPGRIKELKGKLSAMGSVNLVAMEEYDELQQRYEFLSKQLADLKEAKENLQRLITRINQESRARFAETFALVREKFHEVFRRLFNGGEADLILVDEDNLLETGIEIVARPPGKRNQSISLLSGGEKALTAIALLFAIFLIKPSPFCIFDEMDAPLDDNNTLRFGRILQEFAQKSQFIVITHNKITMETAGVLYGVTMQESGVSKIISVKFKGEEARPVETAARVGAEQAALN